MIEAGAEVLQEDRPPQKKKPRPPQKKKPGATQIKRTWTKPEIQAIEKHLAFCFSLNKVPQKHEASKCKEKASSALNGRSWRDIKYYV